MVEDIAAPVRFAKFPTMRLPLAFALAALALSPLSPLCGPADAQDEDTRPTWFIFLETGRKTPDDKEAVAKMQKGHIDNFGKLHGEKKLFAAGPLVDPSKLKRGIVVVKANTREEYVSYFQPDDYVREGYMTLNAQRATPHRALKSEGIDPSGIEEARIVQITRPQVPLTGPQQKEDHAFLKGLVEKGAAGAWYTLEAGSAAEILFCRSTDTAAVSALFAELPSVKTAKSSVLVWPQYIGKGVVP
jgi:uncharacterized protein YciI